MTGRLPHLDIDKRFAILPVLAGAAGIALFSLMDALMKRASIGAGVYPAMLARSLAGALIMGPAWWWHARGRLPARAALKLHLLRGVLVAGMATTFFYGIVRVPLAQGIALSFIAPLLALGLAAVLLGEKVPRRTWLGALLACCGVGVIAWARMRDASGSDEAARGLAAVLVSALLYAWNLVVQRQQAQVAGPAEVAFSQNLVIAAVLLLAAPVMLAGTGRIGLAAASIHAFWPEIVGAAVLSSTSLMLMSWAYGRAEAQALLPLEYTAFLWAAAMGWWWFGEALTGGTIAGLCLILAGVWLGTRFSEGSTANAT